MSRADTPTDAELLRAFAAGDRAVAAQLVARLAPRALAVARRLLADPAEAEDVTQEAMMRLWKMAPDWQARTAQEGGAQVSTWLHRVAVNLAMDRLRRRGRGVALDAIAEPESPAPQVVEAMIQGDRMAALETALATLPDRQRAAVVLRHIEGLSNPEIAARLEVGVEAVESLTARGKRRLAQVLAGRRAELGYER